MYVGYCVSVLMIQDARKWSDIAAQYHIHVADRKKDVEVYKAKGSLNVDYINGSSQDGGQDIFLCSLPFTK